jgi:hypothetical protein
LKVLTKFCAGHGIQQPYLQYLLSIVELEAAKGSMKNGAGHSAITKPAGTADKINFPFLI